MSLNSFMDISRVNAWLLSISLVLLDLNALVGCNLVAVSMSLAIFIASGCCLLLVQSYSCFTCGWEMDASRCWVFQAILIGVHVMSSSSMWL